MGVGSDEKVCDIVMSVLEVIKNSDPRSLESGLNFVLGRKDIVMEFVKGRKK